MVEGTRILFNEVLEGLKMPSLRGTILVNFPDTPEYVLVELDRPAVDVETGIQLTTILVRVDSFQVQEC